MKKIAFALAAAAAAGAIGLAVQSPVPATGAEPAVTSESAGAFEAHRTDMLLTPGNRGFFEKRVAGRKDGGSA